MQSPKQVTRAKGGTFGSLAWIPTIQAPFSSSSIALNHSTGMEFFRKAVPELHAGKYCIKIIVISGDTEWCFNRGNPSQGTKTCHFLLYTVTA